VLASPERASTLDKHGWDGLVRTARSARLLGSLAKAIERAGDRVSVPELPARHLDAARVEARYLRQMTLYEMDCVAGVLASLGIPLILLKGAAYIAQELPVADGRLPRDLDLMVARDSLEKAEAALHLKGWQYDNTLTEYDHHYYRAWTHELPPLRQAGHAFEVDLHHTILPPIGRLKPDAARLIADSIEVPGSPFRVLRPADQVLHAAVHLFQDSDCVGKLRDLVDVDGLIRHFSAKQGERFWRELGESVSVHGLGRPLWYALAFCRAWLETPVPPSIWEELQAHKPPAPSRGLVTALARRTLPPLDPDAEAGMADRAAAALLEFRALWLRMPPWTLAYHSASKLVRSMRRAPASPSAG
jgi:hypothetical protein